MSKYTIALNEIDKTEIFTFDFTLYGEDASAQAQHKSDFIDRFYAYYYFNEINADNVEGFNKLLERKMSEVLNRYNYLFEKSSDILDGSLTDYKRTIEREDTLKDTFLDTPSVPLGQTQDEYATNIRNVGSENEINETFQNNDKVSTYDRLYKLYKDLDEKLIKEFEKCFLMIY